MIARREFKRQMAMVFFHFLRDDHRIQCRTCPACLEANQRASRGMEALQESEIRVVWKKTLDTLFQERMRENQDWYVSRYLGGWP